MSAPVQPQPDPRILANLQRLKDAGAPDDALEAYLAEEAVKPQGAPSPAARHLHARDVARRMTSANEADAAQTPGYAESALGGIAALAKSIPGAEALQAGARSVVRGQPYTNALSDIRGSESDNPASGVNSLVGGTVAAAATPGAPMLAGARYGIASGLLSADPANPERRLHDAAIQGGVGALAGKAGEWLGTLARAKFATKSLGTQSLARKEATSLADKAAYGAAEKEGAGLSHPDVTSALDHPIVKPYADAIRTSPVFAGAGDATVLREAYKLMSEHQGRLVNSMANATDYKAGTSLGAAETKQGKQLLLDAADKIMPSFRGAVQQHAAMAGETGAMRTAADATKRIMGGTQVAGKKLDQNSPEAFKAAIKKMTPEQATQAIDGILGRLKDQSGFTANPLKLFGLGKTDRMAPYLRLLQKQAGASPSLLAPTMTAGTVGLLQ